MNSNSFSDDELWTDVERQLERQRKPSDGNWINFLNRMFAERCGEAGLKAGPDLAPSNCSIATERWAPADLCRRATLHRRRDRPASAERPIFVRYMGKLLVIDGNNRVVQ